MDCSENTVCEFRYYVFQLISYCIALMLSDCSNQLIQWLHAKPLDHVISESNYPGISKKLKEAYKGELHLNLGAHIGNIERAIYIYAVMVGKYELIAGWVVIKAFFSWTNNPFIVNIVKDYIADNKDNGSTKVDIIKRKDFYVQVKVDSCKRKTYSYKRKECTGRLKADTKSSTWEVQIISFYTYVYGNGLSILVGIFLGHSVKLLTGILK